jgi:transposase
VRSLPAADWSKLEKLVTHGRERLGLPASAAVVSCYEAGRDGFWVHRALTAKGIANRVVDSASIEVNRRARRTKTDRVDAQKLVALLVRACWGERHVWREVRVPTVAQEGARHRSRERAALVTEQTRLVNQMRGWLATMGATVPRERRGSWWTGVRTWAGAALPTELQERLARSDARVRLVAEQIDAIDQVQAAAVTTAAAESPMGHLGQLKGVGATSIAVLLEEGLVWRAFQNRRQVGGFLGFAPVPYASGEAQYDQGISRAGSRRLQSVAVQLAWSWVRWQPTSALTQWFRQRFDGSARTRRIGIVAVARRLLIALWRCATNGVIPEGAILKAR